MQQSHVNTIDRNIETTNIWLNEISNELGDVASLETIGTRGRFIFHFTNLSISPTYQK